MFVLLGLLGILSRVNSAFCCMYHRTPHSRIIFPTTTSLSNQTTIGSSMWRLFMLAKGCFKDQSLRLLRRADFTSLHHDPDWRLAIWAPDQQMTGLNPLCYVSRNVHWKLSARSAGVQMSMGFNFGQGMACPLRNVLVFACGPKTVPVKRTFLNIAIVGWSGVGWGGMLTFLVLRTWYIAMLLRSLGSFTTLHVATLLMGLGGVGWGGGAC